MREREYSRNEICRTWRIGDVKAQDALRDVTPARTSENGRRKYYSHSQVVAVLGRPEWRQPRKPAAQGEAQPVAAPARSSAVSYNGSVNATIVWLRGADRDRAQALADTLAGGNVLKLITLALEFMQESFGESA